MVSMDILPLAILLGLLPKNFQLGLNASVVLAVALRRTVADAPGLLAAVDVRFAAPPVKVTVCIL